MTYTISTYRAWPCAHDGAPDDDGTQHVVNLKHLTARELAAYPTPFFWTVYEVRETSGLYKLEEEHALADCPDQDTAERIARLLRVEAGIVSSMADIRALGDSGELDGHELNQWDEDLNVELESLRDHLLGEF
jgi:hypothetical protein